MKKISFILLAFATSQALFAQSTNYEKSTPMTVTTRFGVKAGVNMSEFRIDNSDNSSVAAPSTQMRTSFNAGVFANIPIGGMFRFQPEVNYSGQGSKETASYSYTVGTNTTTGTMNFTQKMGYINVPLLIQLQTTSGFYVEVGPQAGYLISAKQDMTGNTGGTANTGETDNKSYFRKLDWDAVGGIGYLSRIGLGVDARYNWGLRNIYDKENSANANQPSLKNSSFQFGLFWQFGEGK